MAEKTAVRYLVEEINEILAHVEFDKETKFRMSVVSIKAREMEREQIEEAVEAAATSFDEKGFIPTGEDYYKQKYGHETPGSQVQATPEGGTQPGADPGGFTEDGGFGALAD